MIVKVKAECIGQTHPKFGLLSADTEMEIDRNDFTSSIFVEVVKAKSSPTDTMESNSVPEVS